MSGPNAARTMPPGDRDDVMELALDHGMEAPQPDHDDAPPLTDETEASLIARLTRTTSEGTKELFEALRFLAEGKQLGFDGAMRRCAELQTEAAALSRRLSKSYTARR